MIHAVGPRYDASRRVYLRELLGETYREVLARADELNLVSVAIPILSAGAFGWPMDEDAPYRFGAAEIALEVLSSTPTRVRHIRLVYFTAEQVPGTFQLLGGPPPVRGTVRRLRRPQGTRLRDGSGVDLDFEVR